MFNRHSFRQSHPPKDALSFDIVPVAGTVAVVSAPSFLGTGSVNTLVLGDDDARVAVATAGRRLMRPGCVDRRIGQVLSPASMCWSVHESTFYEVILWRIEIGSP